MNMRVKRVLTLALAFILLTSVMPNLAYAAPRAQKAETQETSVTIDLANQTKVQLNANVLPAGANQNMIWATKNKNIATVNSKGLVTAKKVGTTKIGVRPKGVSKWTNITVKVTDSQRPTSLSVPTNKVALEVGDTYTVTPTVYPEGASDAVSYQSSKTSVATVSSVGVITGKKPGTASIRVKSKRNTSLVKTIQVTVGKAATPTSVSITPATTQMKLGDAPLQLSAAVKPEAASQSVTWISSNTAVAKVSSSGEVTAIKAGKVQITAASKSKKTVKQSRTITITDPNKPTKIEFIYQDDLYFAKGDLATLEYRVEPSTARRSATFSSSNKSIVSVDENGKITARDTGIAKITITATGTTLKDVVKVVVLNAQRTTVLPNKTTGDSSSEIKENLAKIDAIRESAFNELTSLQSKGAITSGDAKLRREAIGEAFTSYGFAWKTPVEVKYWNSSLSQNNFKPSKVYYGMPYIQCGANQNYSNRQFNLAKAVTQQYFKSVSGTSRYYTMTDKRMNKFYVGCDCSSFVSIAVWGINHAAAFYNTTKMATSTFYRTITSPTAMRPGDLMVKSGSHTIMFLYYIDAAKTQMMLIENGGSTVSCKIADVKSYQQGMGYTIKRPIKFS